MRWTAYNTVDTCMGWISHIPPTTKGNQVFNVSVNGSVRARNRLIRTIRSPLIKCSDKLMSLKAAGLPGQEFACKAKVSSEIGRPSCPDRLTSKNLIIFVTEICWPEILASGD